jgi:hypothetical protein
MITHNRLFWSGRTARVNALIDICKVHNPLNEIREIVANRLMKAGWNLGWVSAIDSEGRTMWIVDAHRDDGKRYIVHADQILTAFLELQRAIHGFAVTVSQESVFNDCKAGFANGEVHRI